MSNEDDHQVDRAQKVKNYKVLENITMLGNKSSTRSEQEPIKMFNAMIWHHYPTTLFTLPILD